MIISDSKWDEMPFRIYTEDLLQHFQTIFSIITIDKVAPNGILLVMFRVSLWSIEMIKSMSFPEPLIVILDGVPMASWS